jgi:uncharacterized protein
MMNRKLLDILVCPFDKVSSLELFQFKAKSNPNTVTTIANKKALDSQNTLTKEEETNKDMKDKSTNPQSPSVSEMNKEPSEVIEEGLLLCRTCLRFYPITEEIPIILPDELRDKKRDMEFLRTWNESIPNDLLKNLKPWTL